MLRLIAILAAAVGTMAAAHLAAGQQPAAPQPAASELEVATFSAGCFWCTEADFDKVQGVVETVSGFIGGKTKNPTYQQVTAGGTGHAETVQIKYDPSKVSYQQLLEVYWRNVDPLDKDGQFCDRGDSYRPGIFYHSEEQRRLAEQSKAAIEKSGRFKKPIVVEITPATEFTPAENYHQNFYKRNPTRYLIYRHGCGRDARLEALWGKPPTQ